MATTPQNPAPEPPRVAAVVPELGLKLTGVSPSTLTFEDSNGAIYTKSF